MNEIHDAAILVQCPLHPCRTLKVHTKITYGKNGEAVPFCLGCEEYSGGNLCQKCTAAITLMYFHNEPFPKEPIVPPIDRFE